MIIETTVNGVDVEIDVQGLSEEAYRSAADRLDDALGTSGVKNREAIAEAFLHVLRNAYEANPSDLWHHVVYRLYRKTLPRHHHADPKQSWVRASGDALELVLERWYTPVLEPHGIEIAAMFSRKRKRAVLKAMGLRETVGSDKLDVSLHIQDTNADLRLFGGVHVKASLAERVSDDVPASRAMMKESYFSPLWTLDVKSFPPPTGDLVNRGELGTPDGPSEKRRYVVEHGEFDHCYSANTRTTPSYSETNSGKRIYRLNLHDQPDAFAEEVIRQGQKWLPTH